MLGRRYRTGQARLGDHMQPPHLWRMLGNRRVMDRQIVDEDRRAGPHPPDNFARRLALAALVADHLVANAVRAELLDAPAVRFVTEIGQDDDIGDLADLG